LALIELLQARLGETHDGVDHVAEALVLLILETDDVGAGLEDGQGARWEHLGWLELFAA
jgi:hypothetical protein